MRVYLLVSDFLEKHSIAQYSYSLLLKFKALHRHADLGRPD